MSNPFQPWLELCTVGKDDSQQSSSSSSSQDLNGKGGGDEVALRLRNEARSHFEKLSSSSSRSSDDDSTNNRLAIPASPSVSSTVTQDVLMASSSTPNGALALLVTSLGPAFQPTATIDTKVRALHCLIGALEGSTVLTHGVRQAVGRFLVEICRLGCSTGNGEDDIDDINPESDYVDADNMTPEQLTCQLNEMSSTKKSKKSVSSLSDDDVRDAALTSLKALLRSQLEIFPTQQSQTPESKKSHSPISKALGVVHQSMELRLELAMLGLRYRCQVEQSNKSSGDKDMWGGTTGDGYEMGDPDFHIEDGLSHLPRLKRTLCFNLLEEALDGLKGDESKSKKLQSQSSQTSSPIDASEFIIPTSLLRSMATFASLTSSCMHGETDPRCLLQLLRLLNKIQQIMIPFFDHRGSKSTEIDMGIDSEEVAFPSIDIFDAVAPYYPVQFTPPKNDPHGITRGMLQESLLSVFCERGTIYNSRALSHQNNDDGDKEGKETMVMLAGRLFLERLEPPPSSDYDPPSDGSRPEVADKLDALQDLSALLIPQSPSLDDALTRVGTEFLSELSSTMVRVHEEAVVSDSKSLASAIRKFSSRLAYNLELIASSSKKPRGHNATSLWEAYVVGVLRHLAPTLGSAPQGIHGRASTAYFASLAAEGGLMTLNKVLDFCYPQFIGVLSHLDENGQSSVNKSHSSRDEEKLAAAMRGIAALTSSCRVALQKWQRDNNGVQVHPHPLLPYTKATIHKISTILTESIDGDGVGPLPLATVGALESVLTSSDLNVLEDEDMEPLETSIRLISRFVLNEEGEVKSIILHEWYLACARLLGAVISVGLSLKSSSSGDLNTGCERFSALASTLLPRTLASATSFPKEGSPTEHPKRHDWAVLAGSCANGPPKLSEQIVSELVSRIISSLQSNQADLRPSMMVLSYITLHGGPNVGIAFHGLSPPGPTSSDLVHELCQPPRSPSDDSSMLPSRQLQVGMSMLQLPVSRAREEEVVNDSIKRARSILPFLVPAYECSSSFASCGSLIQFVNQYLPPLSEWDEVKLYVVLPLLAAALRNSSLDWKKLDSATLSTLVSMVKDLAQFIASSDHVAQSRSAAASCLFSILVNTIEDCGIDDNCDKDTISNLLVEVVSPVLVKAASGINEEVGDSPTPRQSLRSAFCKFEEALDLMGVLGSAAACKGGSDSQTGDKIAFFLIQLASTGEAQFPFTETTIQLVMPGEQGRKHPLLDPASLVSMLPASAFGSILSVHNGGPFWRQRMTHITLPVLLEALRTQAKSQDPPAMGTLTVVCHLICCLPATLLGTSNFKQIIPTLIAGLVYFSKNVNAFAQSDIITPKSLNLLSVVLAALLKILTTSPDDVTKFIGIIVPSLLILCSQIEELSTAYIPKQLLVLQCLETVAAHHRARNSILREKDQVVAVLSASVDSPSALIRNAVVQVRNVWYTL